MVQYFDEIPDSLAAWILKQKVFWVASAPLTPNGHINLSPKGVEGTFNVVDTNRVWYQDLTGSGVETIAHVRENGRITILFNAFEGPPRLVRLYGRGTAYEFGSPEYDAILPPEKRLVGSRSIIMVDVYKVSTSCGWGVPIYEFKANRNRIMSGYVRKEIADIEAQSQSPAVTPVDASSGPLRPAIGLKNYWGCRNLFSLDGLPGMLTAYDSMTVFKPPKTEWDADDEREIGQRIVKSPGRIHTSLDWESDGKVLGAFMAGALVSALYFKVVRTMV